MIESKQRGLFVVVEGLDRSGKSTLCRKLQETLGGTLSNFPKRTTPIGQVIDEQLRNAKTSRPLNSHSLHLLFAANRHECKRWMLTTLERENLILDRYVHSGAAYGMANGLDGDWCLRCEGSLPKPDIVLFVDLSPEAAAQRAGFGDEKFERLETQRTVYLNFARLRGDNLTMDNWVVLDGGLGPEDLLAAALEHIRKLSAERPLQHY